MKPIVAAALLALAVPAFAQKTTHPGPGSALRKAILDSLRVPIEKQLKPKVVFVVRTLNVYEDWAYVGGEVQRPNGKPVDFNKIPFYRDLIKEGVFDGPTTMGLLRKKAGKWKVIAWVIGPTDVAWAGWTDEFGAPTPLFPKLGG